MKSKNLNKMLADFEELMIYDSIAIYLKAMQYARNNNKKIEEILISQSLTIFTNQDYLKEFFECDQKPMNVKDHSNDISKQPNVWKISNF